MKKEWSSSWIESRQPRKQRKYRENAPLHTRHKMISATLSKELRKSMGRRSFPLRKGDEVFVMRGESKGTKGVVERVDMKRIRVYVDSVKAKKADASEVMRPIQPSNLKITKLNLDDKRRVKSLESKPTTEKAEKAEKPLKAEKPVAEAKKTPGVKKTTTKTHTKK